MDAIHVDVANAIYDREQTDPNDAADMRQAWAELLGSGWTPGMPLTPAGRYVLVHRWGVPPSSLNAKRPGGIAARAVAESVPNRQESEGLTSMVSASASNGQQVDLASHARVAVVRDVKADLAVEPDTDPWDFAVKWYDAGWPVHPLPFGVKSPPLSGVTGYKGQDADREAVLRWTSPSGKGAGQRWNIGLRAPVGVVGIDVDEHGKANKKTGEIISGGATLAAFVAAHGPLPATWMTQGRREGLSGIRWLRIPAGVLLEGVVGPGIEVVQRHHRYGCGCPSWHAEAGVVYRTIDPDSHEVDGPMCRPEDLPELPAEWVTALRVPEGSGGRRKPRARKTKDGKARKPRMPVSHDVVDEWLTACADPDGDMCTPVRKALDNAAAKGDEGISRHDTAGDLLWELACLGDESHHGLGKAYDDAETWFAEVTSDEPGRDGNEFFRMVNGAITKVGLRDEDDDPCDCDTNAAFAEFDITEGGTMTERHLQAVAGEPLEPAEAERPPLRSDREMKAEHAAAAKEARVVALLAECVDADDVDELPAHDPLIHGMINLDSLVRINGHPGSMKSILAMDMACHIAAGLTDWHGFPVRVHRPVVFVVAEGKRGIRQRLRAWEKQHGVTVPRGFLHFLPRPVQAADEQEWADFTEMLVRLNPALIILDTQSRVTVGLGESDTDGAAEMVLRMDKVRTATDACLMLIHHLRADGDRPRGSTVHEGAMDRELRVTKSKNKLVIKDEKEPKDDAPMEQDITLEWVVVDLWKDQYGEVVTSVVPVAAGQGPDPWTNVTINSPCLDRVAKILYDVFDDGIGCTKTEAKSAVLSRDRGPEGKPMSRSSFYTAWAEMEPAKDREDPGLVAIEIKGIGRRYRVSASEIERLGLRR